MRTHQVVNEPRRSLVELIPVENGYADIQTLSDRARSAAGDLSRKGRPIRFLRSLFVPEDGTCYLLFESGSMHEVLEAGRLAALPLGSVSQTLLLPET